MRHFTTGGFHELTTDGGSKTISITPGAAPVSGKFLIGGIDPRTDGRRNYVIKITPHLNIVFDPDAAGSAVSWDKLYKGVSSIEIFSPVMGTIYPHKHTRGAVAGHLIQVLGLGYAYPQGSRTQIPASTDTDVTLDLFYAMPIAHECFADPMESAQFVGFFDGGSVEVTVAASTVYDGDYAGAVTKTGTLRCVVETQPSPRNFIGVPFQWREREIAGGGTSPALQNVGGETSLNGVQQGCGLAVLAWLTNATGIGLNGPDGIDNITALGLPWRGQKQVSNLDGFMQSLRNQTERRVGPVAGTGTTIIADGAGWPSTMDSTTQVDNRPSANSQAMFFPVVMPGRAVATAKLQRILGNISLDMLVTDAITNPHRPVTLELMEWHPDTVVAMAQSGGFSGVGRKRAIGGGGSAKELRYCAIEFDS